MYITGVLIHSRPGFTEAITRSLSALPGVEVHGASNERIVVTVEGDDENTFADTFRGFSDIGGVLSTAMVYHHFESDCGQES
ncbi:MAG: chaperone NapD [Gammaproteobacteria bacterium]|nr:chaperone NapD [Gammaproteobacteria bacterium]